MQVADASSWMAGAGSWVVRVRRRPEAQARLICFPAAGGTASLFHAWGQSLPDTIEVCAVEFPGHGLRLREPTLASVAALVEGAARGLSPYLDRPFALFGHSMGALVAFELARWLRRHGQPAPFALFVSGSAAPHTPRRQEVLHDLPDAELIRALERLDGTPREVLYDEDLMELLLPVIRADLRLFETHRHAAEPPLGCPITAFGGATDRVVSPAALGAWREQTSARFALHMLPGDHFFLNTARGPLLTLLLRELRSATRPHAGGDRPSAS